MKVLLSSTDCAEQIGCSVDSVYKLFDTGKLQGFRLGKHRRIFQESLEKYLKENGIYGQKFEGWFARKYPEQYRAYYAEYQRDQV